MDKWLTVAEIQAIFAKAGLEIKDPATIRGWIKKGELAGSLPKGRQYGYRVSTDALREFAQKRGIPLAA